MCPANVFKKSDKINEKGYFIPIPVNDDKCIKCRICIVMCPEFAISLDDK
jgi:2-oxoglutarate ferredoxin oxidoreductase subunit delta